MTRSGEKTPSPSLSSGTGRARPPRPATPPPKIEAFGRFVQNLGRLEGGSGRPTKGGEGAR
ncbi:hypothetical protein [Bosea sp. PAMC 26642]|uniref:hypothetical protein n=1 Tax=Bosea sp. (strain PAMC 26642) TaxID=1792307 RepID=UPI000AF7B47D|nr:hypothetical protein [Bosea sp. PAMC 26642]